MGLLRLLAAIGLFVLALGAQAQDVIRIEASQSTDNVSHSFYQDLLTAVMAETEEEYGSVTIVNLDLNMSQSRGLQLLNADMLDVFWAGTNIEREKNYGAIPIPLTAGLLGIRVPVIKKENLASFELINTPEQLKKLKACQGSQWPDSDILEFNGYVVERIISFNLMYSMLKQDRCDYFPRGLNEVYAELSASTNAEFMAFEKILLRYPLPMYFFVKKDNRQLQKRIQRGLTQLINRGEFALFIKKHPITKDAFPLERLSHSRIFELVNPQLPATTPTNNPQLWWRIPVVENSNQTQ
ncbi:substrate-binding periplasmic protein [Shewanella subflava]|uniref:Transporter substrate-binding domain-containing protein n=1 Tax=Shewanella subflava TaxID=2986476 RepID=A0ABT3I908_9GAMM|nr:transporter substrate-binding domain-containing protein [Shewanella subflava]MCW3172328.1 transporter substrate-binding domain-containing protein [Shewanella subflava]